MIDWKPFVCVAVAGNVETQHTASLHCGTGKAFTREHPHCKRHASGDTILLRVYCVISLWVLPLRHRFKGACGAFCAGMDVTFDSFAAILLRIVLML